jgi:predicted Na+-dependent transporter
MKISAFIEKYFWTFLIAGIIIGLWKPAPFEIPGYLPAVLLGMMLFFVFLKIDAIEVFEKIRNYKLMIFIASVYMFIIPLLLFLSFKLFNNELALGILLLTAMPAGVSSPALTDILKGNISLAMSIVIVTQLIAPFSVPLLFWLIDSNGLEINKLSVFKDIAILIFLPMILSQVIKKYFPLLINKSQHLLTSANIILLFTFVYIALSSQRDAILDNPVSLIWKTAVLYLVFILLHAIGYLICYKENKENKIALAITAAYMNNGMAIVLASTYFGPDILVLMVLSEIPWNTLLGPFKKIVSRMSDIKKRSQY